MKLRHIFLSVSLLALTSACITDDTDFSDQIEDKPSTETEGDTPESGDTPEADFPSGLTFNLEALDEPDEVIPALNNDYCENWDEDYLVTIRYNGATASVEGALGDCSVTTQGAHVTATLGKKSIHFRLIGASDNGSFKLYGEKRFMVSLADLSLTNPSGAAINSQCGKSMYLVAEAGCKASLADGPTYSVPANEDMKGCIFSEGQIIISGTGHIDIQASGKNALASDDYVVVRKGPLLTLASSAGNGIKTNDGVTINGGRLNIRASAAGTKGINTEKGIFINGGRTVVISNGDLRREGETLTSAAALKCDSTFTMTAGLLLTESNGSGAKGINSDIDVRILGGSLQVATFGDASESKPRAIKADNRIEIANASIDAFAKWTKPLSAVAGIVIAEGYTSLDDGANLFTIRY